MSSDQEQQPQQPPIDLSGDGGCLKLLTQPGCGDGITPGDGCVVSCHYTGTLADGTQFDSSVGREPFGFELGKESVVKGFELAAASMERGERATFTFAPKYGYGAHGSPPTIPGNATLTFAMEMLSWTPPDCSPEKDGGIQRHVLVKSAKPKKVPTSGALVNVSLIGRCGERVFDERKELEFRLCERPFGEVIEGVQLALLHFGRGERSRLVIKPRYAFGAAGHAKFAVPADATVEYEVTLNHFENEKAEWKLDEAESIEQAKLYKERGTEQFRAEEWQLAVKLYEKANSYLSNCSGDGTNESQPLKVAVYLNIALCKSKLDDSAGVKSACNTVLEIDANNVKALYRRGQARLSCAETEEALADFQRCLQIDANNSAAAKQIAHCQKLQKEAYEKDKKLYRNMFSKFASKDNEKEDNERTEETDVLASCGEWNMEEAARKEADLAFKEVDQNVVMI